jgi:hypothetical protein
MVRPPIAITGSGQPGTRDFFLSCFRSVDAVAIGRALEEFVSHVAIPSNGLYHSTLADLTSDNGLAKLQDHFPDRLHYHVFVVKSHSDDGGQHHAKPDSYAYTTHTPYDPFSALNLTAIKTALQSVVMTGQDVFVSVQRYRVPLNEHLGKLKNISVLCSSQPLSRG